MSDNPRERGLNTRLAAVVPAGLDLRYYYISTRPTRCDALYVSAPGQASEKTFCESHFLLLTTSRREEALASEVGLFALEALVYTTVHLTTVFIAKTDSSGYTYLLAMPKAAGSLLRSVSSCFISWLVSTRNRSGRQLVVSLFARAQSAYLFPGSSENLKKHVLDDRGLVKWWCKALDSMVQKCPHGVSGELDNCTEELPCSQAYLIVPGHDPCETATFFPSTARYNSSAPKRWLPGHPLHKLRSSCVGPPRLFIPRFPDDPKVRFLVDLDAETVEGTSNRKPTFESPRNPRADQWKSVKTLEQFWEMMAYRQECSSGRLVGFLWIIFEPHRLQKAKLTPHDIADCQVPRSTATGETLQNSTEAVHHGQPPRHSLSSKSGRTRKAKKARHSRLTGVIIARPPRVKAKQLVSDGKNEIETTKYYHSPAAHRGDLVLSDKQYKRALEILQRLDFADHDKASTSTLKWIHEVTLLAGAVSQDWGVNVTGTRNYNVPTGPSESVNSGEIAQIVNILPTRKRKASATNNAIGKIARLSHDNESESTHKHD